MASTTDLRARVPLKTLGACMLMMLLGGCASIERLAIPDKSLVQAELAKSGAEDSVSHKAWDSFLARHVRRDSQGVARLNYGGVSTEEQQSLKRYIEAMSTVTTAELTQDAQLAYWINFYNALTVDVVLDNYPVASIREIRDSVLDLGPWEDKRIEINGQALSLHDIEHGVVRPLWSDAPEAHYLLNCASVGCPNLPGRAYTGQNIQEMLRSAATEYVNDAQRGAFFDGRGRLLVSKIYAWYRDDFGGSDRSIIEHLMRYAEPALKEKLRGSTKISSYVYDWSLNDTQP